MGPNQFNFGLWAYGPKSIQFRPMDPMAPNQFNFGLYGLNQFNFGLWAQINSISAYGPLW